MNFLLHLFKETGKIAFALNHKITKNHLISMRTKEILKTGLKKVQSRKLMNFLLGILSFCISFLHICFFLVSICLITFFAVTSIQENASVKDV